MNWWTERLDALKAGAADVPLVTRTLRMGLLDDWGEGWTRKTWEPDPAVIGPDGTLFGGHLAALADQSAAFAAMTVMAEDEVFRTTNLAVQYFRVSPALALRIEGRVVARTRRLVSVEVDFRRPDGQLVAKATAQQVVLPAGAPP
ncbi:PaaI family thioesterase [Phenylobacterium sp.]|uniref:PaaI family thioesterase n=1 Tax=Phenylobacterium sp. TaxID=1871053 RepID=UPI0035AF9E85